mgnify:CR=1 FL=1
MSAINIEQMKDFLRQGWQGGHVDEADYHALNSILRNACLAATLPIALGVSAVLARHRMPANLVRYFEPKTAALWMTPSWFVVLYLNQRRVQPTVKAMMRKYPHLTQRHV